MPIFGNLISEIKERLKTLEPVKENKEVQVDYNDIVHELYIDNNGRTYTKHNLTDGLMLFTNFCNTTTDSNYDDWDPSQVGNPGPWWDAVCKMGKWYEQNIHTYQGTRGSEPLKGKNWYDCPLIKTKVADDCSGFVQACLRLHGVDCPSISTSTMNQDQFMNMMKNAGFVHIPYSKENRKPGDIMCGGPGSHTEIFAANEGSGRSFSWGNIHDGKTSRKGSKPIGMPCYTYNMGYVHIWRKA